MLFSYRNKIYPSYLRDGGASLAVQLIASRFCRGRGIDIGGGAWPLPGAQSHDLKDGLDACDLPGRNWDYIFSSHCLEHVINPVKALEHWRGKLRYGGVLFIYLPHPDMEYWRPQHCKKHLHSWTPDQAEQLVRDVGFVDVIRSERDLMWSFAVVGFAGGAEVEGRP